MKQKMTIYGLVNVKMAPRAGFTSSDVFPFCFLFFLFLKARHANVCKASAKKRRKVFDSSRQRAEGTDISTLKPMKPKVGQEKCIVFFLYRREDV